MTRKPKRAKLTRGPHLAAPESLGENPQRQTPVFCLHYLRGRYGLSPCDATEKAALADTLHQLCQQTWAELATRHRHKGGYEKIDRTALRTDVPPHLTAEVNLLAFRFCGLKPMVGYRDRRTFHILYLDRDFTLYDHGG